MLYTLIASVAVLAQEGGNVDFGDLIPVLTALTGITTGFFAARRGEKTDKLQNDQAEITSLIQGYTNQIAAYSGIVESLQQEVLRMRTQFDQDRSVWNEEKDAFNSEERKLRARLKDTKNDLEYLQDAKQDKTG
jgi:predicted nuclease with TOPRIM domain